MTAVSLTDIVKGGMCERFAHLRAMGIKTVMITGDDPLTAALLRRNLLIFGLGGVALPFVGIKAIDVLLVAAGLA